MCYRSACETRWVARARSLLLCRLWYAAPWCSFRSFETHFDCEKRQNAHDVNRTHTHTITPTMKSPPNESRETYPHPQTLIYPHGPYTIVSHRDYRRCFYEYMTDSSRNTRDMTPERQTGKDNTSASNCRGNGGNRSKHIARAGRHI